MPDYTVSTASHKKDWQGEYGLMKIYDLTFESGESAELMQKADTPAPEKGQVLTGRLELSKFGMRFKKENPNYPSGGGQGGGGGGGQRSQMSDADWAARNAIILRQHSQHMALRLLELDRPAGFSLGNQEHRERLRRITDWFDADAKSAADKAKTSAEVQPSYGQRKDTQQAPQPVSDLPGPESAPQHQSFSAAADEEIPF